MMNSSFLVGRFARIVTLAGLGTFGLAACAVEPQDGASPDEPTESASQALINDGRGPHQGFTCAGTTCTCSTDIVGDCDKMRKNCTGDLDKLDACINGWYTTSCSCAYSARTTRPPVERYPIGASSGFVLSP
jgi:hypothetical protein